jgi:hypothetical protein
MRTLKFRPPEWLKENFRWGGDVDRIVAICKAKGYHISEADAHHAWEEYSDSMAAGWMMLSDDDNDVFETVIEYCEEIDYGD